MQLSMQSKKPVMQRITVVLLLVAASAGYFTMSSDDENTRLLAITVLCVALAAALFTAIRAKSNQHDS